MSTDDTNAARRGSGSNDLLGQASEAVPLVERLREMSRRGYWPLLGDEAADEIERLSAQRRDLQAERERMLDSLARAGVEASRFARRERERCARQLDALGCDYCAAALRNSREILGGSVEA